MLRLTGPVRLIDPAGNIADHRPPRLLWFGGQVHSPEALGLLVRQGQAMS